MVTTPVNSLWIGPSPLGPIQYLTMRSFLSQGHPFVLWAYDFGDLRQQIPKDVMVRDAKEILPPDSIFTVQNRGIKSYSLFAVRWMLEFLVREGGWWTHMDVTCLKPLSFFSTPFVFAPHHETGVTTYLMRATKGHRLLKWMLDRYPWDRATLPSNNVDAMKLLYGGIQLHRMEDLVAPPNILGDDKDGINPQSPVSSAVAYHWCQTLLAKQKRRPAYLQTLLEAHKINDNPV